MEVPVFATVVRQKNGELSQTTDINLGRTISEVSVRRALLFPGCANQAKYAAIQHWRQRQKSVLADVRPRGHV